MSFETIAEAILEKLKEISKTETVVGKPIEVGETTLVPISKVSLGFGMGSNDGKKEMAGSGGGVSVEPIAFLVVKDGIVKVLPVSYSKDVLGKLVDLIPDAMQLIKKD